MAKGKSFFHSKAFKVTMSRIYGIGAAIVIVGALFKILHWPFANEMLMVGLLTEAAIFFISAFEPVKEDVDWTLVYPELAGMEPKKGLDGKDKKSMTQELDKMLEEARIEQNTINRLGEGLRTLSENVKGMTTVSEAALATNEYAQNVKEASQSMQQLNSSYTNAITAIEELGKTGDVSASYYEQVSAVTQKMSSLNSIYEMELQESNNHLHRMNEFYGTLSKAMANLSDSEDATLQLKNQFTRLTENISSLNNVYGGMLSAMTVSPRVNNQ